MRTVENHSTDWSAVRKEFEAGVLSNRALAKKHGVSEAAIRKHAKKDGWRKPDAGANPGSAHSETAKKPSGAVTILTPASDRKQDGPSATIRKAARTDPKTLADDTLDVLARLRDELDTTTCYLGELEDLIIDETAGDKNANRRNAMLKAVSLPVRILAAKNLSLALKTLQEAQPGKKKQAEEDAKNVGGAGSAWGDDLDVGTISRAN